MLNYFYLYALIWSGILIVYSLGWSDLCASLEISLLCFFVITIIISLFFGYLFRGRFSFRAVERMPRSSNKIIFAVISMCCLEFVYCRQIPLFSILRNGGGYTSFYGIPSLHPLIITFASFYAFYIFYLYVCFPQKKELLWKYGILLCVIYLLYYNRGGLMIHVLMAMLMYLSSVKTRAVNGLKKKQMIFYMILALLLVIAAFYIFGGLGNMRHGFAWDDTSYMEGLGRFNDRYPAWLPKQFMWAYIYIITPLANINYNIALQTQHVNFWGFVFTFVPDFLTKRIYDGPLYYPEIVVKNTFNATAGFGNAYMNGGIPGMYYMYVYLMFGLYFLLCKVRPKHKYQIPYMLIMDQIVVFLFFTNTIAYSAVSFSMVYPMLSVLKFRRNVLFYRQTGQGKADAAG